MAGLRDEMLAIYEELRDPRNSISLLTMSTRTMTQKRQLALNLMQDAAIETVIKSARKAMPDLAQITREDERVIVMLDGKQRAIGYQILSNPGVAPDMLQAIFKTAENHLEPQARHRAGDPRPVAWIWRAIIENSEPGATIIRLTTAPKSPFCRIVGLCYQAMGRKSAERAIRNFVTQTKARDQGLRAQAGIDKGALRARGRPRRAQQKAAGNSGQK
jgi:hypothetical protein